MSQGSIQVFDSQGAAYKQAFQVFLQHTDQKRNARVWLHDFVQHLPVRETLIDAGAGSGELTGWLTPWFRQTIAIEPNAYLLEVLQQAVPAVEVISKPILEAEPQQAGDLVLCSYTLYYIPRSQWLVHLQRLLAWMAPGGATVVIVQDHETDCMAMLQHFLGHRFVLAELAAELQGRYGDQYHLSLIRDAAYVETTDFASAYTIAEFMLNLLPITVAPRRRDVEEYIHTHFAQSDGRYRFSCHQDFLVIRQHAAQRLEQETGRGIHRAA